MLTAHLPSVSAEAGECISDGEIFFVGLNFDEGKVEIGVGESKCCLLGRFQKRSVEFGDGSHALVHAMSDGGCDELG